MDVRTVVKVLRRGWWAIILLTVGGVAGGYVYGHRQPLVFEATAQSFVNVPTNVGGVQSLPATLVGSQLSTSFVDTYARVATTQAVAQRVVDALQLPEPAEAVQGSISTSVEPDTFLIDITVRSNSPIEAAAIANATADALHDVTKTLQTTQTPVIAQTLDRATPPGAPISPKPRQDAFLGGIFALLVSLALLALLEALDRTIRTTSQAAELLDAPVLGMIPRRQGGLSAATLTSRHDVAAEAYRSLRTAIRFLEPDRPPRTLLVTSATPGDGKTTTAANLAITLAEGGERVIVVDCDLRRAGLSNFMGLESAVGVTSILRRHVSLEDALQEWNPNLRVLPTGTLPPNPAELLGSQAMASLIEQLSRSADVVVIDAPPVLPVTDAVVLGLLVDGLIMVVRHGKTLRSAASESLRRIVNVGGEVSGVALNSVPRSRTRDYYVDYGYRGEASPELPARSKSMSRRDKSMKASS